MEWKTSEETGYFIGLLIFMILKEPLNIVYKISNNDLNGLCLETFAKISIKIACSYLKANKNIISLTKGFDSDIIDLAVKSVTPLFINSGNGKLGFHNSLENWNSEIISDPDAEFFINCIIWNRCEQEVFSTIKGNDPFFKKIFDTISECVRKNNYKKINRFGKIYIVRNEFSNFQSSPILEENFDYLPKSTFALKQNKLIESLFNYLLDNGFPEAIPLNRLIKSIKNFYFDNNYEVNYTQNNSDYEIKEIISLATIKLLNSLEEKYIKKNKLTKRESIAIKACMEKIVSDVKNGEAAESLFSYMQAEMPELESDIFYKKYHNIINYLLKEFREEINNIWKY
ncbi:MAG: hypothetical protein V1773_00910 [bacterium]